MAFKCYRKLSPKNPVRMPDGTSILFKTVDGVHGYYATQDALRQSVLDGFIRSGDYGLSEVSENEFHEFLEKKSRGLTPPSREEFAPGALSKLIVEAARLAEDSKAAAVDTTKPSGPPIQTTAAVVATAPPPPTQAPTTPEFTPPVGKRRFGRRKPTEKPE